MQPMSPVDVISPAFRRTRTLLYPPGSAPGLNAPFRFGFFLKIVAIAALTQGNIYGFVFGIAFEALFIVAMGAGAAGIGLGIHRAHPPNSAPAPAFITFAVIAFAVIAIPIGLLFAWIWCRLRFTLFDLVLYRHGRVARAWSPYRSQTRPSTLSPATCHYCNLYPVPCNLPRLPPAPCPLYPATCTLPSLNSRLPFSPFSRHH